MPSPLRLVFDPQGPVLEAARDCEAEVFLTWFGNTREQLGDEYGPYEDSSVFMVVADEGDDVLAAVRLLVPGGRAGLKTLVDVGEEPWGVDGQRAAAAVGIDPSSTWEVATLGARGDSAVDGARLSVALYHGLMTVARVNEMTSFVAILDQRVRRLLSSVGILTRPLPGTRPASYLGSEVSLPVYSHYASMRDNQRRRFPDAYRLVTLGVGLDGVSVPPADHFRLNRPAVRQVDLTTMESTTLAAPPLAAQLQRAR